MLICSLSPQNKVNKFVVSGVSSGTDVIDLKCSKDCLFRVLPFARRMLLNCIDKASAAELNARGLVWMQTH